MLNNFFNCETEAVLPYNQFLGKLPDYLQQASMESNGKSVDRDGNKINYETGDPVHPLLNQIGIRIRILACRGSGSDNGEADVDTDQ